MDSTAIDFRARATKLKFEGRAYIDGGFRPALSGKTFDTLNPANGKVIASIAECAAEDVDAAVAAARRAFESGVWSKLAPRDRKKRLLRFADLIEQNMVELALLESLEAGKAISHCMTFDLPDTFETLRWHAEFVDKLYDQVSPTPSDVVSMVVRDPIGVVATVLPWNFPLYVAILKIAPALAGGNSIVIKPAEQTSLSTLRLAALASEAGIPDGVFNVVPGFGETTGQAIGRHMDINCVSFTGSGEVGRYFLRYSAESNMKRIVLECGGKSPAIVLPDAPDLSQVAQQIAFGILYCQGENCSAGSRLLVHSSIKEKLIEEVQKAFRAWPVGDPLDPGTRVGAMIEQKHLDKVLSYIETGKTEGAKVIAGGNRTLQASGGYFVEPTIFDAVDNKMRIAQDEIFGPVLSVISFDDTDEAVRIANDTRYGLASSLYTSNLGDAHRIARQLRAGTVSVNCFSEGDLAVPFGGFKESGFGGRDKSAAAHDQYTEAKTIWIQLP